MKIVVERTQFWKAWQVAMKYTPTTTTMEALNGIRIMASLEGITLEASDLKSAVKYPVAGRVDEAGEAVLNAAIFGDMLKKAGTEQVVVETTAKRGILATENSEMRFAVIPADTFPNLPESSNAEDICEIDEADFVRIVGEGSSASSNPSEFPKYMGTCLLRTSGGMLTAVATDGRRLSSSRMLCDVKKDTDLVVPAPSLKDLVKTLTGDGRVQVKSDGAMVWFIVDGAEYSLRLIDVTFPKYEKILKDEFVATIQVSKEVLVPALERVAVIAKNTPDRLMALSLKGGLMVRARATGLGTVQETIEGAYVEGTELSVGFNVNLFLAGVRAASADEVLIEFSGAEEQARIYNKDSRDFLYMLMSMRLSSQDMADEEDADERPATI